MKAVYKVVVIEQVTERVWYEVTDVESEEEAMAAYWQGEATETYHKHLSTGQAEVEDVYQEEGQSALPIERPELFLEHEGVGVYHCYDDDSMVSTYWYTTDATDCNIDFPLTDDPI